MCTLDSIYCIPNGVTRALRTGTSHAIKAKANVHVLRAPLINAARQLLRGIRLLQLLNHPRTLLIIVDSLLHVGAVVVFIHCFDHSHSKSGFCHIPPCRDAKLRPEGSEGSQSNTGPAHEAAVTENEAETGMVFMGSARSRDLFLASCGLWLCCTAVVAVAQPVYPRDAILLAACNNSGAWRQPAFMLCLIDAARATLQPQSSVSASARRRCTSCTVTVTRV